MPILDGDSIPAPERSKLIQSTRNWSPLPDVSLAVSVATEHESKVYVERPVASTTYRGCTVRGTALDIIVLPPCETPH